jgi:mono/diheme cytochrome c family protein
MDGEQIYYTRCMSCHQMGGRGVPGTFPPLTNTDWVTGDKGRLIRLLLHGLTGPIEVDGVRYSGVMPPWGDALDDQGIADIATYIRTSFGNEASPITTEEVAAVRAATKRRTKPWTAKELNRPANRGVPSDSTTN